MKEEDRENADQGLRNIAWILVSFSGLLMGRPNIG